MANIPTLEERNRVISLYKRAHSMVTAKNYYSQNWIEYEKIWHLFEEVKTGENAWRATLPDTWTYATIKTAQAAFVESQVVPIFQRHEDDDLMKSTDLQFLYKDIMEKGDMDMELYYARLDAFKFGVGFLKTFYVKDKRTVHQIKKFNAETDEIEYEKKEINDFDDPKTIRVSPWFMLVDDTAKADVNTIRDCFEIEVLSWDEAKAKYEHLVENWDDNIKKVGLLMRFINDIQKIQVAQTPETTTRIPIFKEFRFFAPYKLSDNQVEILHYWNKFEDSYEIIINGFPAQVKTKKKATPIPYIHKQLPYTPIQYSPYGGDEFWCAGIIELGRAEAREIRKFREMQVDRQKLHLFSPVFSDVNDEIDQRVLQLKPLSIIRTTGGVPKQFTIPGVENGDFQLQQHLEDSYKRTMGIDERTLGVSGSAKRITATEMQFLRDAAMRRLREFAFLYKRALLREVRLKLKLFEQYFSSPFHASEHSRSKAIKQLKIKAKQFKIKVSDNVYRQKEINPKFFEGSLEVDIDMQVLIPMTQSQLVTKWAQVMRDVFPFVQAGILKLDMVKVITRYLDALDVNIKTLQRDEDEDGVIMAEGEHKLYASKNTSDSMKDLLPNGTPPEYLTPSHIKRHQELMVNDADIETAELSNLAAHIAKDLENFQKKTQQMQATQQVHPQSLNQVGGMAPMEPLPAQPQTGGAIPVGA